METAMRVYTVLVLLLILLSVFLHLDIPGVAGAHLTNQSNSATVFLFENNCPSTIWPGVLTGSGSAQFPTAGFELATGASTDFTAPPSWAGRFWPRTLCNQSSAGFKCGTGDCASDQVPCRPGTGGTPPATLVEFKLNGDGGKDFYDVSLVDGFNVPMSVAPSGGDCSSTSCPADVNVVCPMELAVTVDGKVVACKSACLEYGTPEYCCSGAHGTPDKCGPSRYSKIFKSECPQAYSYAYDDKTSTFTCPSGGNYVVTFCPSVL